jgi:hypothetical protein
MAHRREASFATALITLAIVGCGDSTPTTETSAREVSATITRFSRALANGEANNACAEVAPGYQPIPGRKMSCTDAMMLAGRLLTDQQRSLLRSIKVTAVSISGDSATATVAYGNKAQRPQLRRFAGQWRIVQQGG